MPYNEVTTTHKLDFLSTPFEYDETFTKFKVGTCHGLYGSTTDFYSIIAIINENPGNGHFTDVLEWFEHSCRRDKKSLRVVEIWNESLYVHLLKKRGFKPIDKLNVVKRFNLRSRLK